MRERGRKYCRTSSNAAQNHFADSNALSYLPTKKPRRVEPGRDDVGGVLVRMPNGDAC